MITINLLFLQQITIYYRMDGKSYTLKQTLVYIFLILGIHSINAQSIDQTKVFDFVRSNQEKWQLTDQDIEDLRIVQVVETKHNGVKHVYLNQQVNDVDVEGATISLHIAQDGQVHSAGDRLVPDVISKTAVSSPKITVEQGLVKTSKNLGVHFRTAPKKVSSGDAHSYRFSGDENSLSDISGQLKYVKNSDDRYQLVWTFIMNGKDELWDMHIDALTGELISKKSLTVHCQFEDGFLSHPNASVEPCLNHAAHSGLVKPLQPEALVMDGAQYHVLPLPIESPSHGERTIVTNPAHPVASPLGWHDADGIEGAEYTTTRGNNVYAYVDRDWDDGVDAGAEVDGGEALLFDFEADFSKEPVDYQDAAVTNLFYVNNMMHDLSERYGFDEGAGNFQNKNYGLDGIETDYVFAMAQRGANDPTQCGAETNNDVDCINNANFGTPGDGSNPSMRMFVWSTTAGGSFLRIDQPVEISGLLETGVNTNDWGGQITSTPLTGEVIIVDDGSGQSTLGCNPIVNDLNGKIALIDRGTCDFSEKVYHAQNAGAIAAIISNFEEVTLGMSGGDFASEVTIPAVFIKASDGALLRSVINDGLVVSLIAPEVVSGPDRVDGDFDNGIIAHEYTHGISNRLTGGSLAAGCLRDDESSGMGEGWSDFMALIATVRPGDTGDLARGVGTYAQRQNPNGRGLRPFPYSTNMNVNPHTYEDIAFVSIPHGVGSVWCAMLWDLYWAFVDAYGFDEDLFDGTLGNNMAIQLVVDAMKLQTCNPGFVDARDAILLADELNNGGANKGLIWEVFARRGLGWGADQGDQDVVTDGKSSFETCPSCSNKLSVRKEMTDFIEAGDEIDVTLLVGNYKDSDVTNVEVRDMVPEGATPVPNSGSMPFEVQDGEVVFSIGNLTSQEEMTLTYKLASSNDQFSESLFLDDMENGDDLWDIYFDENGGLQIWEIVDLFANSGENTWFVSDTEEEADHWFQFREPFLIEDGQPVLRFYHNYETEARADAGFVSISTDGGLKWKILDQEFIRNGYNGRIQYGTFAIPNLNAFWGNSGPDYIASYVDLSDYIGEEVLLQWRFGTDDNTAGLGWFVDDIEIMNLFNYNSEVCITSAEGDQDCALARNKGTLVETGLSVKTEELTDDEVTFQVYPNPASEIVNIAIQSDLYQDVEITLNTATGASIWNQSLKLTGGIERISINATELPAGMYFVKLRAAQKQRVVKVVLQ